MNVYKIILFYFCVACASTSFATISGTSDDSTNSSEFNTTKSGLKYKVYKQGNGLIPKPNDLVTVRYLGKLTDGTVFDTNVDTEPTSFTLNRVIKGFAEGLQTMKAGGRSILHVPPDLAYGDKAVGVIPENSTLIFEVELLKVVALQVPTNPNEIEQFSAPKLNCGTPPTLPKKKSGLAKIRQQVGEYSDCTKNYHIMTSGQLEAIATMGQQSDGALRASILSTLKTNEKIIEEQLSPAIAYLKEYHKMSQKKPEQQ